MFFDGEKNSVLVAVCGVSVPEVCEVVEVVPFEELVVVDPLVVDVAFDVVVVDEEVDGLLEQAASASAHAGRTRRRIDHVRNGFDIVRS
jgi:hypothetical protein